jgi:hypothetical protein
MNSQRVGKIARLSNDFRDLIGLTLQNGESAKTILKIINDSSEVQCLLGAYFGGHPITEQNLSEWKTGGGYQDWLRDQQGRPLAKQLTDRAAWLDQEAGNLALSDHLATILTEQFSRLALRLLEEAETDPEKQWRRLCQINRELSQLRRADHRALQLKPDRERWEWTQQQARAKAEREKHNARKSEDRELGAMLDRFATDLNAQTRALTTATPRGQRPASPSALDSGLPPHASRLTPHLRPLPL